MKLKFQNSQRQHQGFTLIEMIIVVMMISILASIAYPSYTSYVNRGHRAEARAQLMRVASTLERVFTERAAYPAAASFGPLFNAASGANIRSSLDNPNVGTYSIQYTPARSIAGGPLDSYTLIASKTSGSADLDCGLLTLTSTGAKPADPEARLTVDECWRR